MISVKLLSRVIKFVQQKCTPESYHHCLISKIVLRLDKYSK